MLLVERRTLRQLALDIALGQLLPHQVVGVLLGCCRIGKGLGLDLPVRAEPAIADGDGRTINRHFEDLGGLAAHEHKTTLHQESPGV